MKICHIISGLNTGGAEMMLYNLLSTKNLQPFEHTVVSLKDEGTVAEYIKRLGVPVICMGMSPGRPSPKGGRRLLRLIRNLKPDIIQGWMYEGNFAAFLVWMMASRKSKLLWNIRFSLHEFNKMERLRRILIRLESFLSSFPLHILYNSRISMGQHEKRGFSSKRSVFLPNGINCDRFKPDDKARIKLRSLLKLDFNTFLIGRMARYHSMKDYENLILAAKKILSQFPHVHFVLTGRGVVQSNSSLFTKIQDTGFQERFHIMGDRRDIPEIMAGLDVHVSSSCSESFPNVVGEAMACGVPSVVTDVGDSREIVGGTGIVVPPKDFEALAQGLVSLIKMDTSERSKMGEAARERIVTFYSLPSMAKHYEKLYLGLLTRSAK
ncbi:glycosyltransferase [Acidobacteriota bacterium]